MQRQQVALVTGGNRGIGFEIARQCVEAGFQVILTARDEAKGRSAAQALGCDFVQLDLDDHNSAKRCASEIAQRYGQLDALINNASMAYKHADTTPWVIKARTTVMTNYFGTWAVMEACAPLVRPGGRVVVVASSSGHLRLIPSDALRQQFASADTVLTTEQLSTLMLQFVTAVEESRSNDSAPSQSWPHVAQGWPNSAYGMSKLAQVALTKIYARLLKPKGITVNCCCPGSVSTGMNPGGHLTAAQGADTPTWLACQSAGQPHDITGQFFSSRRIVPW